MSVDFNPPGYRGFHFLHNPPIRTGIWTGVCLSLTLTAWIMVANRVPSLELFAQQRNIVATLILAFFAAMPVLRFLRSPGELLVSGLLAWGLLTLTYRVLTFVFVLLEDYYSAFHVFVLGAVAYLFFATLSWVGIMIWRARAADGTHSPR
ncbi:MAG TPA: hypothetical protein VL128_07540 [Candidatus Eisenbacteria bacterium]|nr:hypothetical protein [Candidatus Eisenbacteria bacterium]